MSADRGADPYRQSRMPDQRPPTPATFTPIPVPQEAGPIQPSLFPPPPGSDRNQPNIPPPPTPRNFKSPGPNHDDRIPQRIPYWLHQAERFLRVIVRIYIGLVVCLVPWYPPFWDSNPLFAHNSWLTALITQGAIRGLVSGLGLLNLWFAIRELILNAPPSEPR